MSIFVQSIKPSTFQRVDKKWGSELIKFSESGSGNKRKPKSDLSPCHGCHFHYSAHEVVYCVWVWDENTFGRFISHALANIKQCQDWIIRTNTFHLKLEWADETTFTFTGLTAPSSTRPPPYIHTRNDKCTNYQPANQPTYVSWCCKSHASAVLGLSTNWLSLRQPLLSSTDLLSPSIYLTFPVHALFASLDADRCCIAKIKFKFNGPEQ